MRAFIAIEVPKDVKENIGGIIEKMKKFDAKVKWVKPENLHVTLKFLGEVQERYIGNLASLTEDALKGKSSFEVHFGGTGSFPGGKNPRVIWIGTSKGWEREKELAESIDEKLSKAGYEKEEREFSSHMTIGRVKERRNIEALLKALDEEKDKEFGSTIVDHVNIMKSTLTTKGPIYEVIKKIDLVKS